MCFGSSYLHAFNKADRRWIPRKMFFSESVDDIGRHGDAELPHADAAAALARS
jgi:hypothetical protein